jgi:myxalamid-type polyketide synthase MxaB
MYSKWGGYLDDIDQFSAEFFGIAPREAMFMDPQQRLLLEVGWEALENAAIVPDRLLHSQVGVFVGLGTTDYGDVQLREGAGACDAYNGTGGSHSVAVGRLSYLLGVRGPSLAIDTACSSSLATIHLAVNSLRNRESDLALAGGVNLSLYPDVNISLCKARMLSPDGRCKTFDRSANGYVRGEGCGVVVLKRLSDALAAGDNIMAVIRGSAVNHDGRSSGLTVPSGPAQQELIRRALRSSGLGPSDVSYIEAHGTGTPVGDPIEIGALGSIFGERTDPLLIGSVKTNTGHLEWAAGVCGVIKVVLAMRYGQIPASLHFKDPNPHIAWNDLPIRVVTEPTPWPAGRRIAGISSFGFGGTNAHILVEEPPATTSAPAAVERPLHVFTLSAKSNEALRELAGRYATALNDPAPGDLADICYTANSGRSHFAHRLATVVDSNSHTQTRLQAAASGENVAGVQSGHVPDGRPKIAMLFTGQGSQFVGMGRELYETQPTFRRTLDQCDEVLRGLLDRPLMEILYPAHQAGNGDGQLIHQTAYTQPALFALEYALAELWRDWGVRPSVVLGHSVGEYVAACVAGVFSLEDGLRLIAARGRLMQSLPRNGIMVAVRAAEARVAEFVAPHAGVVSIATINGPQDVVISGERRAVESIAARLQAESVATQPLTVSHAFHSPLMEPVLAEFHQVAKKVRFATPSLGLISNVTGQEIQAEVTEPPYWVRHVREAVRFAAGMATLASQGCDVYVEVGPHPTLLGLGRQCLPESDALWLPSLRSKRGDWQQLLESLGTLYVRGAEIDWAAFDRGYSRRKVELPTYPFERKRYWFPGTSKQSGPGRKSLRPLIDTMVQSPLVKETIFSTPFSTKTQPYVEDHRIFGEVVVPGACYLGMILSGAELLGQTTCQIEDVLFQAPLVLQENEERTLQAVLTPEAPARNGTPEVAGFQIISLGQRGISDESTTHVTGRVSGLGKRALAVIPLAEIEARSLRTLEPAEVAASASSAGIEYGPSFLWIDGVWLGERESLARLRLPEAVAETGGGFWLHPGLLDSCFQVAGTTLGEDDASEAMVPFAVKSLKVTQPGEGPVWWCHAALVGELRWDIRLTDAAGLAVLEIEGFEMRRAPRQTFLRRRMADWLYRLEWQPQPLADVARLDGSPGTWLILSDGNSRGEKLAARLMQQGERCVVATRGAAFERMNGQGSIEHIVVNPDDPADIRSLLDAALPEGQPPCKGIVCLWGTESPRDAADTPELAETLSVWILHLVQALSAAGMTSRLWLLTEGGQAVQGSEPVEMAQAAVWGLGRTLLLEHPELECVCVDLSPEPVTESLNLLQAELRGPAAEPQVAYRSGERFVARLVRHRDKHSAVLDGPFRLQLAEYGSPDQLRLVPLTRRRPGPGEIEIDIKAASLNFRDVLITLGMLRDYYVQVFKIDRAQDVRLGFDCAGTIATVGEGVTDFKVGDEVMTFGAGSFASFLTLIGTDVVHKPVGFNFETAAAIPTVFYTAHYCLFQLAQLKAGERVLIHAAAGGVGQAAVQLAQAVGAEVFATASPAKWDVLKSQGVHHVMNSRTLDFADDIMRLTEGKGVDVVLNNLTGEAIDRSFAVLKPGGRFAEIGKLGIWTPEQVAEKRPDAAYWIFDLFQAVDHDPASPRAILGQVREWFQTGRLHPLPQRVFPVQDAVEAYRVLQQARQVGKVVLSFAPEMESVIRSNGSYLITGGLGALGLKVAQHFVEQGARQIVLAGRGTGTAESVAAVEELRASGATVQVVQADVAKADDVARLIGVCQAEAPLRGIVHAAGVLDDGVVEKQNAERFARVMGPKVHGAWNLHTQTQGMALDFFVCFSSMASMFGSPGQSNYAAANAFLDALAHQRRALGLPGLSINWGPWAEAGMAAKLSLAGQGIEKIDGDSGLQVFAELLESAQGSSLAQAGVFRVNWPAFRQRLPSDSAAALISALAQQGSKAKQGASNDFLRRFHDSAEEEREALLESYIHSQLLQALGQEASKEIAPTQPWQELGLDSLMMVELKNRLDRSLQVTVPVQKLMQDVNTRVLTSFLLGKLNNGATPHDRNGEAADSLSEDDLEKAFERIRQIPQAFVIAEKQEGRRILVDGRWRLDLASCNYLGLDFEPEVMAAIPPALAEWGVHPSWSRAVASPKIYDDLERELAGFVGAPKTLVFPSISLLHYGVLPILAGYDGVILKDTDSHHSIHEGCLRAHSNGADWVEFRHNDIEQLTQKLAQYPHDRTKIIATDGVYSMGAANPPLLEYARLAKKYNALLYVDDAHGFGVIGERPNERLPYGYRGNGLVRHLGLDYCADRIVYVAGLSKAFSSYAAFVTCFDEAMKWKLQSVGPYVFSGPTCVASLASALAGLRVNARDGDQRRQRIFSLTHRFVTAVQAMGFEVDNSGYFPIVGVVIGSFDDMATACKVLWEQDILITPAIFPAVPMNRNLVRVSITAANTEAEVERALGALQAVRDSLYAVGNGGEPASTPSALLSVS